MTAQIISITEEVAPTVRIYFDFPVALNEFIIAPLADRFGMSGEEVELTFDTELIFSNVTEYDSINGDEGFRLNPTVSEERFWAIVENCRLS